MSILSTTKSGISKMILTVEHLREFGWKNYSSYTNVFENDQKYVYKTHYTNHKNITTDICWISDVYDGQKCIVLLVTIEDYLKYFKGTPEDKHEILKTNHVFIFSLRRSGYDELYSGRCFPYWIYEYAANIINKKL